MKNKVPHILVVGDVMLDHYICGTSSRISPEAPIPVVDVKQDYTVLGGAGNVVRNLCALGAHVSFATVIGEDSNSTIVEKLIKDLSIRELFVIKEPKRRTTQKTRIISQNQQIVRFDIESQYSITESNQTELLLYCEKNMDEFDSIILSDYSKGVLNTTVCQRIIEIAKKKGKKVFVDPKGNQYEKYKGAYLITPNKKEITEASGIDITDKNNIKNALYWIKEELQVDIPLITLSEDGIVFLHKDIQNVQTKTKDRRQPIKQDWPDAIDSRKMLIYPMMC